MYLVESPDDVWKLTVKNEDKLSFMTQTTLSVDDTSDVIDALRKRFPKIVERAKMTSVTPPPTARKRYALWQSRRKWYWSLVRKLIQLQSSGGTGTAYGQTRVFD